MTLAAGGGVALFVAITAANASNFLFHVVVSRRLEPADYGGLGALLGMLLVLAVPATALQVVLTRRVAALRRPAAAEPPSVVVGPLLAEAVLWGTGLSLALVAAAPLVRRFLHLPTTASAVMLGVFVFPAAIAIVPKSVLLGQLRLRLVAFAILAGAMARLGLAVLFIERGAGIDGAMAATVLGEVITAAILLPALRSSVAGPDDAEPLRVRWREARGAVLAFASFWVLCGLDTLLARHYLPEVDSGLYAAGATGARSVLFLSSAVALIAVPRFAAATSGERRSALLQALGAVGVLSIAAVVVGAVAPEQFATLLFGEAYRGAGRVLRILLFGAAGLGLINVIIHYLLATDRTRAASWSWIGVGLALAATLVVHGSILVIAVAMVVCIGLVLAAMLRSVFPPSRPADRDDYVGVDLWTLEQPAVDLTLVVPYYNPGDRLRSNLEAILRVLEDCGASHEVVAVSDGCTDGSELTIEGFDPERVRRVVLPANMGKGHALRIGLAMGRGRYVGFIDSDGDVDPAVLRSFLTLVRTYEPDVVLGSKRHPLSELEYPPLRRVYSWGYQQLTRAMFRLNIRDTQTGVKLVRREVLAATLPRMLEKRFAFDLELLVVARHLGYQRFFEAPVKIAHQFSSTISARSVRSMLLDTLAIFYRLRLVGYYDHDRSDDRADGVPDAPRPEARVTS